MTEHREQMDDETLQQHRFQQFDRLLDRRLEFDEQITAAMQEKNWLRAVQKRENADLPIVA